METLLKHKDFIEMVARDLIRPDNSNDNVKEILAAYSKIDSTAEILVGCSTCDNKFKDTFKIILAYVNSGTTLTVENITKTIKDGFDSMDSSFKPKSKK